MNLSQEQAAQTAFTVPGQGQFQWNRTLLGVIGAQASFHLLLTTVLRDIKGVLIHTDRVIVYHQHWEEHLTTLRLVLQKHGLTLNLQRLQLGTDSADVMGFRIAQSHIPMAPAQIEVSKYWEPTKDAKMIRSFLGLTNFFQGHNWDYTNIAAPLNWLLPKRVTIRQRQHAGGRLRSLSTTQTHSLQCPYSDYAGGRQAIQCIVDASTGAQDFGGGLGAILTQMDKSNRFSVIANA